MHFDDQDDDDNEDDVNGGHIRTPELSQMDEEERWEPLEEEEKKEENWIILHA